MQQEKKKKLGIPVAITSLVQVPAGKSAQKVTVIGATTIHLQ